MGHFVETGTTRPDPEYLEGLAYMEWPHTKCDFRRFSELLVGTEVAETVKSLTALTINKTPNVLPWRISSTGVYAVAYRVALATFPTNPTHRLSRTSQADVHNRITHQKFA